MGLWHTWISSWTNWVVSSTGTKDQLEKARKTQKYEKYTMFVRASFPLVGVDAAHSFFRALISSNKIKQNIKTRYIRAGSFSITLPLSFPARLAAAIILWLPGPLGAMNAVTCFHDLFWINVVANVDAHPKGSKVFIPSNLRKMSHVTLDWHLEME